MLPVILLGPDATVRDAFEAWNDGQVFAYPDAEIAQYALVEQLVKNTNPIEQNEAGAWRATVVYGPHACSEVFAGSHAKLAHTGWTVAASSYIADDQFEPRRVIGGELNDDPPDTLVWEAATRLGAHLVLDVTRGMSELTRLLSKRDEP